MLLVCHNECFSCGHENSLRSVEMLASRAALVCGLAAKYWASPGGLSGRCGLSIWSDGGSSLIPLSLGEGDQTGEPDTESLPVKRALRKSLSACSACCSICWVKTLSLVCMRQQQDDRWFLLNKDLQSVSRRNYRVETKQTDFTVSRTFGSWNGQVWWLPWCPVSSWRRLPSFWSSSHSSFSVLSFWSNSQSSSSVPSHPWNDISCYIQYLSKDDKGFIYCYSWGLFFFYCHDPPSTHCTVQSA